MKTTSGRLEAEERSDFMRVYLRQLAREIGEEEPESCMEIETK